MENPKTWSPLAKAVNLATTREPKELLDSLILQGLVPEEPYWELLAAISDAIVDQENEIRNGVCGSSMGAKAERRLLAVTANE